MSVNEVKTFIYNYFAPQNMTIEFYLIGAAIAFVICIVLAIRNKEVTVGDIAVSLIFSLFTWYTVFFMVIIIGCILNHTLLNITIWKSKSSRML